MTNDTTWFLLIFNSEEEKVRFPKVGTYTSVNTTHTTNLHQFCDDPWKMKLIQTDDVDLWEKNIEKHKDKIVKAYIAVGYKNFFNRNFQPLNNYTNENL